MLVNGRESAHASESVTSTPRSAAVPDAGWMTSAKAATLSSVAGSTPAEVTLDVHAQYPVTVGEQTIQYRAVWPADISGRRKTTDESAGRNS